MNRKKIADAVGEGRTLVSDGSWGTLMQKEGLRPGECPELWCLEHPDAVLKIAVSYIEAGADMIQSNSFGGSSFKLEHYGLGDRVSDINEAAVAISRRAAGENNWVIPSLGPSGKILMMGDVSEEELYEAFREQVVAFERGGADAVCIETMSALDEASLAVKAARENTSLEIICTFTFERTLNGDYRTMMGITPADMASTVLEAGADIIGTNCGNGMDRMIDIVREMRGTVPDAPIIVHANAGLPVNVNGNDVFPETPEQMASKVGAIIEAGANIVGGCCGTTPEHIRAIKEAI